MHTMGVYSPDSPPVRVSPDLSNSQSLLLPGPTLKQKPFYLTDLHRICNDYLVIILVKKMRGHGVLYKMLSSQKEFSHYEVLLKK